MKVRVGIVGLPNVGKSTLFNALAQQSVARAENFPFCTIEPNVAPIPVPSRYLEALGSISSSTTHKLVPATMEWVDVAGLVRGASRGEGLGNRFLATIRECSCICHVLRVHEDPNVVHVHGSTNPVDDAEVVNLELILADLNHVQRRLDKPTCVGEERRALEKIQQKLVEGVPARTIGLSPDEQFAIKSMGLLTLKPVLYAFNVDEADFVFGRKDAMTLAKEAFSRIQYCDPAKDTFAIISAKVEQDVCTLPTREEQIEYVESLGMELENDQQLDSLMSYTLLPTMVCNMLGRALVYTGPGVPPERSKTTKAHLFKSGELSAMDLAGRLHGDFVKGFMCAEVISAPDLIEHSTIAAAKEAGLIRSEGREYLLNADDVVLIKWK